MIAQSINFKNNLHLSWIEWGISIPLFLLKMNLTSMSIILKQPRSKFLKRTSDFSIMKYARLPVILITIMIISYYSYKK